MLARKEDLSVFASSAFTFACTSASSISFRWVTVIEVPIRLSGFPFASRSSTAARTSTHSFCCGEGSHCLPTRYSSRIFCVSPLARRSKASARVRGLHRRFSRNRREVGTIIRLPSCVTSSSVTYKSWLTLHERRPVRKSHFKGSCRQRRGRRTTYGWWISAFAASAPVRYCPHQRHRRSLSFWNVWR